MRSVASTYVRRQLEGTLLLVALPGEQETCDVLPRRPLRESSVGRERLHRLKELVERPVLPSARPDVERARRRLPGFLDRRCAVFAERGEKLKEAFGRIDRFRIPAG